MEKLKKNLIDELEAEILNQYLMIVWFEDYSRNSFKNFGLNITCVLDEQASSVTIQDWLKLAVTNLKIKVKGKKNLGSQRFQIQSHFTVEEYNGIYEEMVESSKDSKYDFIKEDYGYSISDLIRILDQLATFKKELEKADDKKQLENKENFKIYKEILHDYIGLNTLTYGIKNPSLKQRIAKGRNSQGGYQKIVKAKKQIFFDLLIEQTKNGSKYKNVSQAVNENIDEVMRQFQKYDESWIELELDSNRCQIMKLNQQKLNETLAASELNKIESKIIKLSNFTQKLEGGLSKGYPFESLDNILPYNTVSLDEVLIKALRLERNIKEQCIEPSQ